MPIQQKDMSLDKNMNPVSSPNAQQQPYTAGIDFEMQNEVQQRFVRSSIVNLRNVLSDTNTTITTAVIAPGSAFSFGFVTFFNVPHQNDKVLGAEYVSIYQQTGTVTFLGTAQFFPWFNNPTGIGVKDYYVQWAYNWHHFDGIKEFTAGVVRNDTNGTQTIQVVSQALWLNYNSGSI